MRGFVGLASMALAASAIGGRAIDLIEATVADDREDLPKPRLVSQTNTVSEDPDVERPLTRQQRRQQERLARKGRGMIGGSRRA